MAHVVVVTQDLDVRMVLDVFLHAKGHVVLSVPEPQYALPALEVGRYPAVVIIHAPAAENKGFDLLRKAVSSSGNRLARHSYIILTSDASVMSCGQLVRAARLKAQVLELPFDLEEVAAAVEDADSDTLPPERGVPAIRALSPHPPADG